MLLDAIFIAKPWGRDALPPAFSTTDERIGEISFAHAQRSNLPLLVKYIFTSEKLSIQVHPNDQQAEQRGLPSGKNECWYIVDAEVGATIGLGLTHSLSAEALRSSACDGSIEGLMSWKPVKAGDFFFVPAGTIHAIGAGISLVEFQQNVDVTYRLFDYGRPRELHLEDAVAVADPNPYCSPPSVEESPDLDRILVSSPMFTLVKASANSPLLSSLHARDRWVIPLNGYAGDGTALAKPGQCLFVEAGRLVTLSDDATLLIGVSGPMRNVSS